MIQVHIVVVTRLTRAALPLLLTRDRGSIINVASTAAFLADPGSIWNTYAATKAFVLTFTVGLHEDVRGTGVRVQALCPGWTRTEILERAGRRWDVPEAYTMGPDQVVEASLAGLRHGELVCCPSLHDGWLSWPLLSLPSGGTLAAAGRCRCRMWWTRRRSIGPSTP
jgi:short-subunit dehydrogenase